MRREKGGNKEREKLFIADSLRRVFPRRRVISRLRLARSLSLSLSLSLSVIAPRSREDGAAVFRKLAGTSFITDEVARIMHKRRADTGKWSVAAFRRSAAAGSAET